MGYLVNRESILTSVNISIAYKGYIFFRVGIHLFETPYVGKNIYGYIYIKNNLKNQQLNTWINQINYTKVNQTVYTIK